MKKMRKMTIGIVTVFVVTNVSLTSSVFASRICINRNIYDNVQIASLKEKSIEILKEESTDIINGELSESPSEEPKATPGENPSEEPSERPSEEPTMEPSESPSEEPTMEPSESPGEEPTMEPSESPGEEPTMEPSESPGEEPTMEPSENPSGQPIEEPNEEPIQIPNREGKNGIYYAQVLNEGDPSGILLDGEFNDWASIDKINYGQNGMSQIAAYWYGDYFYLYVEEEDRQGNAMCFTWNTFFEWTSNH